MIGKMRFEAPIDMKTMVAALPVELLMCSSKMPFSTLLKRLGGDVTGMVSSFISKCNSQDTIRVSQKVAKNVLTKLPPFAGGTCTYILFFIRMAYMHEKLYKPMQYGLSGKTRVPDTMINFSGVTAESMSLLVLTYFKKKKWDAREDEQLVFKEKKEPKFAKRKKLG